MILCLLLLSVTATIRAGCPSGWLEAPGDMGCLFIKDDFLSWDEAAEACKQLDDKGHLVEINTEEEEKFVRSQIHTNYTRDIHDVLQEMGAGFWIGATNIDSDDLALGTWHWAPSGKPVTWTNWHQAEGGHEDAPNNKGGHQNCVVVTWHALHGGWQGSWNDLQCDLALDGQGRCQDDEWTCKVSSVCQMKNTSITTKNVTTSSSIPTKKIPTSSSITTGKVPTSSSTTTRKVPTSSSITTGKVPTSSSITTRKVPTSSSITTGKVPTSSSATTKKMSTSSSNPPTTSFIPTTTITTTTTTTTTPEID